MTMLKNGIPLPKSGGCTGLGPAPIKPMLYKQTDAILVYPTFGCHKSFLTRRRRAIGHLCIFDEPALTLVHRYLCWPAFLIGEWPQDCGRIHKCFFGALGPPLQQSDALPQYRSVGKLLGQGIQDLSGVVSAHGER